MRMNVCVYVYVYIHTTLVLLQQHTRHIAHRIIPNGKKILLRRLCHTLLPYHQTTTTLPSIHCVCIGFIFDTFSRVHMHGNVMKIMRHKMWTKSYNLLIIHIAMENVFKLKIFNRLWSDGIRNKIQKKRNNGKHWND